LQSLLIPTEEIFGRYAAKDLIDESTGRIWIEAGDEVSPENLDVLDRAGWTSSTCSTSTTSAPARGSATR
jgi:copper homeostasis protein CutC